MGAGKELHERHFQRKLARRNWTRPYSLEKNLGKVPYDPDDLDIFAVVDGNGGIYVIPIEAVAGPTAIYLSAYDVYVVGNVAGLLN